MKGNLGGKLIIGQPKVWFTTGMVSKTGLNDRYTSVPAPAPNIVWIYYP
jgi:hypothetical protein